jgi:PKD repeat protein
MNIRKILNLVAVLTCLIVVETMAQSTDFGCASDEKNDSLITHDPVFSRSFFYFENAVQQVMSLDPADRTDEVYTIPVVIHVIHEGEATGTGTNISDEQIYSAIEALNDDFRKVPGTPGFGDGVDVGVQFCLAQRDPSGDPSSGIVRVNGSVLTDYAEMGIEATTDIGAEEEEVKGLSTWPRDSYINIWIVNEIEDNNAQSGVQGYAYFPVNSSLDGIVVLYNAFGTVGNLKPSTAQNRTITHEMGHSLSLYHTFHNTSACTESNCTTGGDKVCDTPITTLNSSCSSPACSGNQQVENYLDYTPESCKNMFTEGQKLRMRTSVETDRASLLNSLGCVPVSNFDIGISAIVSPTGTTCESSVAAVVSLINYGSVTITSATIQYNLNGVGNNTYNWTGSLVSGMSTNITLPSLNTSNGTHTLYVWTVLPNGTADQNVSNDQRTAVFSVTSGINASLLVEVDFFGGETTWEIISGTNEVAASGGPYANNQQGLDITENLCLAAGCYTLHMHDSYGDGQSFTQGDYTLFDADNIQIAFGSGNWGEEAVHDFCVEEIPVVGVAPVANFAVADNYICKNGTTSYTDLSTNVPTSWSWTFEGGTPSTSSSQNPSDITYNTAGTFDITLVASNATGSNTFVCANCVTVSAGPTSVLTGTSPTCNNGTNGSVSNAVTGNSPFTYSWSSGQTSQNLSNVASGSYTVTVTDINGCTKQSTSTLTNPTAISISHTITHVSCNGENDGAISASATGGAGSYTFTWNTSTVGPNISNLDGGTYVVTATDANSCIKTKNITVNEPAVLQSNLIDFDIACGGSYGSAQLTPAGGTTPYAVSWSNGASGNTVANLSSGNYTVVLTDSHDCVQQSSFTISSSPSLAVNISAVNISCNGNDDGTATALAGGGNGNYTYLWSNGAETQLVSGLAPGTYSVEASDSNGCSGSQTVTISEPAQLGLAVFKTDISCHGMANGTATATASGGSGNKTYSWSTGQTTNFVDQLAEGTYLVTTTDDEGCSTSETITINEPSQLIAQIGDLVAETCEGGNGAAIINCMGGTPVYTYLWSNGSSGQINSNLSSGSYIVLITDANNCTASVEFDISYDCETPELITQLIDGQCDNMSFAMTDIITCETVLNAAMYQWKFISTNGDMLGEQNSIGPAFYINQIPGIENGLQLNVQVKALVNNEWGPYGPLCSIGLESLTDIPAIADESCGTELDTWNTMLFCNEISGAFNYEWKITGPSYEFTLFTADNELQITEYMLLIAGTTYQLQVRCGLGQSVYTEWSAICDFTISMNIDIAESNTTESEVLLFFPNPSDGRQIFLDFSNLKTGSYDQDLMIFNTSGNLVERIDINILQSTGNAERYTFRSPLASGIYFIRYTINDLPFEEKMIVR